jgi:hypothetical protein
MSVFRHFVELKFTKNNMLTKTKFFQTTHQYLHIWQTIVLESTHREEVKMSNDTSSKIVKNYKVSPFFHHFQHFQTSPLQDLEVLMPKVKNTTDSFDEVINHLFFDSLYGF